MVKKPVFPKDLICPKEPVKPSMVVKHDYYEHEYNGSLRLDEVVSQIKHFYSTTHNPIEEVDLEQIEFGSSGGITNNDYYNNYGRTYLTITYYERYTVNNPNYNKQYDEYQVKLCKYQKDMEQYKINSLRRDEEIKKFEKQNRLYALEQATLEFEQRKLEVEAAERRLEKLKQSTKNDK